MNKLKIIQISDTHIANENELPSNVDVRNNFTKIIDTVKVMHPDVLIITGDLINNKSNTDVYYWIKDILDNTKIKYFVIPGNHDDSIKMAEIFDLKSELKQNNLYYLKILNDYPILFLDSSRGFLDTEQLKWMEEINNNFNSKILMFLHHPITKAGSVFMDNNYSIKNDNEILSTLERCENIKYIFCGHYHTDKTLKINDKILYITPSTWFQIDTNEPSLKVASYNIAYRFIEWDGSNLNTWIKYLES